MLGTPAKRAVSLVFIQFKSFTVLKKFNKIKRLIARNEMSNMTI